MVAVKVAVSDKRKRLGEVIKFNREQRRYTIAQTAQRTGLKERLLVAFEEGTAVPDREQWPRLWKCLGKNLLAHKQLLGQAQLEERMTAPEPVLPPPPTVVPEPKPEPAAEHVDEVQMAREKKKGARTTADRTAKVAWLRDYMASRGPMSTYVLMKKVREEFPRGLDFYTVRKLQEELYPGGPPPATTRKSGLQPPLPERKPKLPAPPVSPDLEENLATAAQMLVESIPGLTSFTLTVDPSGEVRVAYQRTAVQEGTVTVPKRSKPD